MIDKNTGGPAFPQSEREVEYSTDSSGYRTGDMVTHMRGGMTLRDYFAAKAMQAYIQAEALKWQAYDAGNQDVTDIRDIHETSLRIGTPGEDIAYSAYSMADNMLLIRENS